MKVYVVIEEDRGMGIGVEAVYFSKEKADGHAADSSHLYVYESELDVYRPDGILEDQFAKFVRDCF